MPSNDRARRRAIRAKMATEGLSYTQAMRALDNDIAAGAGAAGTPPAGWPPLPAGPAVRVSDRVDYEPGQIMGQPGRWGHIERTVDGWLITPSDYPRAISRAREVDPVDVDYRDSATGHPAVVRLPAVVWLPTDRSPSVREWVWAATGWPVAAPGQIADADAVPAPAGELPYEVRIFDPVDREAVFGLDWTGSPPAWETRAWCASLERAREFAAAVMRWGGPGRYGRAQVWGPGPAGAGRRCLLTLDPPVARPMPPRRPYGTLPDIPRPVSLPPDPEPAWQSPGPRLPVYTLRVWSPDIGWSTMLWTTNANNASLAVRDLCVGVDGHPYLYADVCGPPGPNWYGDPAQLTHSRLVLDAYPALGTTESWNDVIPINQRRRRRA